MHSRAPYLGEKIRLALRAQLMCLHHRCNHDQRLLGSRKLPSSSTSDTVVHQTNRGTADSTGALAVLLRRKVPIVATFWREITQPSEEAGVCSLSRVCATASLPAPSFQHACSGGLKTPQLEKPRKLVPRSRDVQQGKHRVHRHSCGATMTVVRLLLRGGCDT